MNRAFDLRFLLLFCLLVAGALPAQAEGYFDFSPKATQAYEKVISLRFEEARQLIYQIKDEEPDNLIVYHIENYIDFFTVFIRENKSEFEKLERNKSARLDKIKSGSKESPYYLYTQAEIHLQWALARLKFEQYFDAFNEVKAAYKQLKKNQKKFPDFMPNYKSLGILHALIGTIPDNYKWGVKVFGGMTGTIEEGRREIQKVVNYSAQHDFIFEEETLVMYAFLLLHLKNQSKEAWSLIRSGKLNPKKNPLACFVLANVAMRTGKNDEAIRLLENRPRGKEYFDFQYLDYMLGLAKLYRLDDDADYYLKNYALNFEGQNYIKQAYQKLSWFALLQYDDIAYQGYLRACINKGEAIIDGDKNALKEANAEVQPHPTLLKGRLLFDGGYYKKAYRLLRGQPAITFTKKHHQLEYYYRLGRIAHKLEKKKEALEYYQRTIDDGAKESLFYACNAALQMGLIYEEKQQYDLAKKSFKLCLSMKPDDYRNSLHQKAKSGINRLKQVALTN